MAQGFERPPMAVLPGSALVPERNRIVPAPNRFTHRLTRELPFRYAAGAGADGALPAATAVVLLRDDGGGRCRVVDGRGLYGEVECDGLASLDP